MKSVSMFCNWVSIIISELLNQRWRRLSGSEGNDGDWRRERESVDDENRRISGGKIGGR
jgi:hypothetical protein